MGRVLVLVGPPGVGKSTIGAALSESGTFAWRDWEVELMDRWGSGHAFLEVKGHALEWLDLARRDWIGDCGRLPVIETTALSDGPFLESLSRDHEVVLVLVDAPTHVASERTIRRPQGRHLFDDPERSRSVRAAFDERVRDALTFDLVIDTSTATVPECVSAVSAAVRRTEDHQPD